MRRAFLLAFVLIGCGGDQPGMPKIDASIAVDSRATTADAGSVDAPPPDARGPDAMIDAACVPVTSVTALALEDVARNLTQPIATAYPPGDGRLFVAEKGGTIRIIENGVPRPTPFLDITAMTSKGSEQGLLGMAFHPSYAQNGRYFVSFTDAAGDTRIWEYHVSSDRNVSETQEFEIFFQDQPNSNHNGGQIFFGPDGKLYIALGDGGSQYDPSGNGQRLDTYLAKVLRIDIDVDRPERYKIPPDNPFVGRAGAKGEIWVHGLRNPWRMSFDRETGDLWIGDVGQDKFEEVDLVPAGTKGQNFGWGEVEGLSHCPKPPYTGTCSVAGETLPIHEYGHDLGNAIVGGYVYRGCRMPELRGAYFFSDNGGGFIRSFRYTGSFVGAGAVTSWPALAKPASATFGEDPTGEIIFCSLSTGRCYRIIPAP